MFSQLDRYTNTQNIADMLKTAMGLYPPSGKRTEVEQDAVRTLQEFERAMWIPFAFDDAMSSAPGEFYFNEEGMLAYSPSEDAVSEIAAALSDYLIRIAPMQPAVPPSELYTTKQAADFLSMSVAGVKKNIYVTKRLRPARNMATNVLVFTREELERFQREERHQPGFEAGSKPKK